MKKATVVTRHLYGPGGGAQAALAFTRAARELDYDVVVHSIGAVGAENLAHLGDLGVGTRPYYNGCSYGADLLLNIDHFTYEKPLAKINTAHVFHPHGPTESAGFRDNRPPDGYQRLSANSFYTSYWCEREWGMQVPHLYIPIRSGFYQGRKTRRILHVSRFAQPQELADKGHTQLIRAFQWMCDSNSDIRNPSTGWELCLAGSVEDLRYFNHLQSLSQGYPITFYPNVADADLRELYASASFYWHATGASLPNVHGAQEHLGLTTLEAMRSGCVPVVLGTGGQTEVVTSEHDGVCCVDTPTMGRVTLELMDRPEIYSLLQRHAVESAEPWQDWAAFVGRVENWLAGNPYQALPPKQSVKVRAPEPKDVCLVVPVHGDLPMTLAMLESVLKTEPSIGRIVVVDNASPEPLGDDVVGLFARYGRTDGHDCVVSNAYNCGYARACNQALLYSDEPYLLTLNNDMLCKDKGWLSLLLQNFSDPDVGVVGCKLLFPDGNLQHAGGRFDLNRPDVGYHFLYGEPDQPGAWSREPAPYITGACLLARRELWGFESAGIGYEDADLCLKAHLEGWKVLYDPAVSLVHFESQTRRRVPGTATNEEQTRIARDAFLEKWAPIMREVLPWVLRRI